jgi:hypothetical protein
MSDREETWARPARKYPVRVTNPGELPDKIKDRESLRRARKGIAVC